MGTRSLIGKVNEDGTVTAIYCHWDGYISHNGHILRDHYDTQDKVDQLIALGGLSTLDEELDKVVSYHLWRNEPIEHLSFEDKEAYLKELGCMCSEYLYLFENDKWFCSHRELGEDEEYDDDELPAWNLLTLNKPETTKESLLNQKEKLLKKRQDLDNLLADIEQALDNLS